MATPSELLERMTRERDNWQAGFERQIENTLFYRNLVVQIGEKFGRAAHLSDDGTVQDSVLCLKVPGLVDGLREALVQIANLPERTRKGPTDVSLVIEIARKALMDGAQ